MTSLWKIWENMDQDASPLKASGEHSQAMQVIRAGLDLRGEDANKSFWDDFIQLTSNTSALAELLDVRPEQVAKWHSTIQELVDRVREEDCRTR